MNILKHAVKHPFVFATGLAALLHSTWSLGTLFSGNQPEAGLTIAFLGWIMPAFLIAFALEIGQIFTASEIAAGNRSLRKYATFGVLALATFYLQWLYMAHHMPSLDLGLGIRTDWKDAITGIRDAAIWVLPALLPLSIVLDTFSHQPHDATVERRADEQPRPVHIVTTQPDVPALATISAPLLAEVISEPEVISLGGKVVINCPACDWSKEYETEAKALNGLKVHQRQWCVKTKLPVFSNGAHD